MYDIRQTCFYSTVINHRAIDSNPIFISSGLEREFKTVSSSSKPDLSLLKVNFETTF